MPGNRSFRLGITWNWLICGCRQHSSDVFVLAMYKTKCTKYFRCRYDATICNYTARITGILTDSGTWGRYIQHRYGLVQHPTSECPSITAASFRYNVIQPRVKITLAGDTVHVKRNYTVNRKNTPNGFWYKVYKTWPSVIKFGTCRPG